MCLPRPRVGLGHGTLNVQYSRDRVQFNMLLARVNALIRGNDVFSVTIATVRGQLEVIV